MSRPEAQTPAAEPRPLRAAERVRALEALLAGRTRSAAQASWGVLPFKDERLDSRLPAGGLARGRWHELGGTGRERELPAAAAGFAACLARRCAESGAQPQAVVWILQRDDLHAPGLPAFQRDPDRLIFVRADRDDEVLAALEGALRCRGVGAVVGEVSTLSLAAGKRLQLACEQGGATGFVLRRRLHGVRKGERRDEGGAATTRWSIAPAPSGDDHGEPGLGLPRWRVTLERCRGGRTGSFILEADDATGDVRVVAELGDHASYAGDGRQAAGPAGGPRHHDHAGQRATAGGG